MLRRLIAVPLAFIMFFHAFPMTAYADTSTATISNFDAGADSLYIGGTDDWPRSPVLEFATAPEVGDTVQYQWYRCIGEETGDSQFQPEGELCDALPVSGTDTKFKTAPFYRSPEVWGTGIFTYYVVFTYTPDGGEPEEFESNHQTTYIAPQVLYVADENYTAETYYYFQGTATDPVSGNAIVPFTITLELPPGALDSYYDTIHYQWYKSTVPSWGFEYDEFPFFNEDETPAIPGESGTIPYDEIGDGYTVEYIPVNDEVGHFNYYLLVWNVKNEVMSYTPSYYSEEYLSYGVKDLVIEVLPKPVTSIQRGAASATVNLLVTLPEGKTVQDSYKYKLVARNADPGDPAGFDTGTLTGAAAALTLSSLNTGAYDLHLKFTDDTSEEWTYKAAIPAYSSSDDDSGSSGGGSTGGSQSGSGQSNPIDAKTTDGSVTAEGTVTTTGSGTTVNITGDSFTQMAAKSEQTGGGVQVNTPSANITFDAAAVSHINELAGTGDIKIEVNTADISALPPETQELIGDRPVYDFNISAGDSEVSSFGGGTAHISIPYELAPGELPEAVVVYYIDDDGNLIEVRGAYNSATKTVDLIVEHFSYYAVGYKLVSFADVTETDWFYKPVTFIAARGIAAGIGDGLFAPYAAITRGQFITMLMNAYGIAPDTEPADNFADAGDTYYTGYLAAAKRLGIAAGTGDNMYSPDASLSYQDMITLTYRALDTLGELPETEGDAELSAYPDSADVAGYAGEAFSALLDAEALRIVGGQLRPLRTATRAEMADILYKLLSV